MTRAEHAQQKALVLAAERLSPSRSQRHGTYARRAVVAVVVVTAAHAYAIPVVREKLT